MSMILTCPNWILITLRPLLPFWDNILIINIGMTLENWPLRKSWIANIWLPWIPVLVHSQSTLDIKDISGWWLWICPIMNLCSLFTTLSYKVIWNTSNLRFKNKCQDWLNPLWLYIRIFAVLSERPLWISIMNSILDTSLVCSKACWSLNLLNSRLLTRSSNCGSMSPKESMPIDWSPLKTFFNIRASCSTFWRNLSLNSISKDISKPLVQKT